MPRLWEDYTEANGYTETGMFPVPLYGRNEISAAELQRLHGPFEPSQEHFRIQMGLPTVSFGNIAWFENDTAGRICRAFEWLDQHAKCAWSWYEGFGSNNGRALDFRIFIESVHTRNAFAEAHADMEVTDSFTTADENTYALARLKGLGSVPINQL
jgi:hypothetical protein